MTPHTRRSCRPAVEPLEGRTVPAHHLVLSGITAATAGVAQAVTVTAVNPDGSTDTTYAARSTSPATTPRPSCPRTGPWPTGSAHLA